MFGYVRAHKPEMKVKDYEQYKAVYCSLCKELGRSFGIAPRMTLSYDFTFLSLLRLSLSDECPKFEKKRCVSNPLKKCSYCENQRETFIYTSSAAVIMVYYKLHDNLHDAGFFKKIGTGLAMPLFYRAHKKAAKLYPNLEKYVSEMMKNQLKVESENSVSIDAAAEPTARALSNIVSDGIENEEQRIIVERIGYCVGRWVYLLDAVDDFEKDLETGDYNPFRSIYDGENKSSVYEKANEILERTLWDLTRTYNLLECKRFQPILENILNDGMYQTQQRVLKSKEVKQDEKSV